MSDFVFVPGVIASKPDHRDWLYAVKAGPLPALPPSYRLPEYPVGNQGNLGSCVGWGGAAVKESQENVGVYKFLRFSPLFIYRECKQIDGLPDQEGTTLKAAMQVLQKIGACLERSYPYTTVKPFPQPDPEDYEEAAKYKIGNYVKIQTLDELKAAVMDPRTGAVLAAVLVCKSFTITDTGFVPMPGGDGVVSDRDTILGAHAIAVTGWDDNLEHRYPSGVVRKGFLRFRNSWGKEWGDKGYGWLPYDFFYGRADFGMPFFWEAWTSIDLPSPPTPAKKIELWAGSRRAVVDGVEMELDQPAVIDPKSGRLLVPVRFISEMAGYRVDWDAEQHKATFTRLEG